MCFQGDAMTTAPPFFEITGRGAISYRDISTLIEAHHPTVGLLNTIGRQLHTVPERKKQVEKNDGDALVLILLLLLLFHRVLDTERRLSGRIRHQSSHQHT